MLALLTGLLQTVLGFFFPKKVDPSTVALADSNAHATDVAAQETADAQVLDRTLQARTAADTGVMRHDPAANEVHSDPDASVNKLDGEHFRD